MAEGADSIYDEWLQLCGDPGLDIAQQEGDLLARRPELRDSRVNWWLSIFDRAVWHFKHAESANKRIAIVDFALRSLDLARRAEDLSEVDAVIVLADLGRRASGAVNDLMPEPIVRRALTAIKISKVDIPAIVARERRFLLEDQRAWFPYHANSALSLDVEFEQLDELRRILPVLEEYVTQIDDKFLAEQVTGWSALKGSIQHGAEIGARGRSLLGRFG